MRTRKKTKFVHEGRYVAQVDVDLIEEEGGWSPYLSVEDARKLDRVREALREGDLAEAAKFADLFELRPVTDYETPVDSTAPNDSVIIEAYVRVASQKGLTADRIACGPGPRAQFLEAVRDSDPNADEEQVLLRLLGLRKRGILPRSGFRSNP